MSDRVPVYPSLVALVALILLTITATHSALADGPEIEWRTEDADGNAAPIHVNVDSPIDNTWVPIRSTIQLVGSAYDVDSYRSTCITNLPQQWGNFVDTVGDGEWSSNTLIADSSNHHIWWTKSGEGTLLDEYGEYGSYKAPEFAAGQLVRTVTITIHADDFQRNGDTSGDPDDSADTSEITLKVWEVEAGFSDPWESAAGIASPLNQGGTRLGFRSYGDIPTDLNGDPQPGTPVNGYYTNRQIKGTLGTGAPTSGYSWAQLKKGESQWYFDPPGADPLDWYTDTSLPVVPNFDANDPNSPDGPIVGMEVDGSDQKIYMHDAPGQSFSGGALPSTNPPLLGYKSLWKFQSKVVYQGLTVSNLFEWSGYFGLGIVNGQTTVTFHQ